MVNLYSRKYNIEYYHIPKNGMTSIINTLNFKWEEQKNIPKDRKVLCILRDPIDRFVSSYFFLKKHPRIQNIKNLPQESIKKMFLQNEEEGFKNYLSEIKNNGYFDNHNLPQIKYINDENGLIPGNVKSIRSTSEVTNFILFKNMTSELKSITDEKIVLKHMNSSKIDKNFKNKLKSQFGEEIINLYKKDYNLYKKNDI